MKSAELLDQDELFAQLLAPGCHRNLTQNLAQIVPFRSSSVPRDFERNCQQSISSQNRDAIPKNFVTGRTAATEVIIVHAGKVVMNKGVGVDTFQGAGQRER